jgi:hypothetical protein
MEYNVKQQQRKKQMPLHCDEDWHSEEEAKNTANSQTRRRTELRIRANATAMMTL